MANPDATPGRIEALANLIELASVIELVDMQTGREPLAHEQRDLMVRALRFYAAAKQLMRIGTDGR